MNRMCVKIDNSWEADSRFEVIRGFTNLKQFQKVSDKQNKASGYAETKIENGILTITRKDGTTTKIEKV